MSPTRWTKTALLLAAAALGGCGGDDATAPAPAPTDAEVIARVFGDAIRLDDLPDYDDPVPRYVRRDNAAAKPVTGAGATLGRVLFHDTALSVDRTVSCASCHHQALAFGDSSRAALGIAGRTPRHSMRLVNVQFAEETRMFWDERALDLEDQVLQPLQDPVEMGFTGTGGAPGLDDLLARLQGTDYYRILFTRAFGDSVVTAGRLQDALAQFVRSIRSFDARYDEGRGQVGGNLVPFPNYTAQENHGKELFMRPPDLDDLGVRTGGGLACAGCHRPPEFDIDPVMGNNGVIRTIAGTGLDQDVTRAPTLRDVLGPDGAPNGPLMHTGDFDLDGVLDHYDVIDAEGNTNLDNRLNSMGNPQRLQLTAEEREAVKAFLRTLTGTGLYTDPRWSDPFVR